MIGKREPKTALTFEEKVKAAYLYFVKGIDQHTIAEIAFDGINQGRVNEACVTIEKGSFRLRGTAVAQLINRVSVIMGSSNIRPHSGNCENCENAVETEFPQFPQFPL